MKHYFFRQFTCLLLVMSCMAFLSACNSDEPVESMQDVENENVNMPSITIYADGTTSTGDIFKRVTTTRFYINDVKYAIDAGTNYAKVIGCRETSVIKCLEPYARINIDNHTYYTYSIAAAAFYNNKHLEIVNIPEPVEVIENMAFSGCNNLKDVKLPKSLTTIEHSAFSWCALSSIDLPSSLISIGDAAFYQCALEQIVLPHGISKIGRGCFADCVHLKYAYIPSTIKVIPQEAFYDCSNLSNLELPESIGEIGERAFYRCLGITEITFSSSIIEIGEAAFCNCNNLKTVKCHALIPPRITYYSWIGYKGLNSFDEIAPDAELHIPASAMSAYQIDSWISSFSQIIADLETD